MWLNSTIQKKKLIVKRKYLFQLTIIKNSLSKSIETSFILIFIKGKKKSVKRFQLSIKLTTNRWEGLQEEVNSKVMLEVLIQVNQITPKPVSPLLNNNINSNKHTSNNKLTSSNSNSNINNSNSNSNSNIDQNTQINISDLFIDPIIYIFNYIILLYLFICLFL